MSTTLPRVATICAVWIVAAAGLGPAEPLPTDTPTVTQTLSDDFDDSSLDTALWTTFGTVVEGSRLTLMGSNGNASRVETKIRLMGRDQDVETRVEVSDFVASEDCAVLLGMAQEGYENWACVYLHKRTSATYALFQFQGPGGSASNSFELSSAATSLRLLHRHDTGATEGFVDLGAGWVLVGDSGSLTFDESLGIRFMLYAGTPSGGSVSVEFDNFFAQGGQYVPPQLGEKGLFERYTWFVGANQRDVRMVVPSNYNPSRPIGILFGFHGALGSSPRPEPYLEHLLYSGWEQRAAAGYFITASMSNRKKADGWSGGWNNTNLTSGNVDAQAVLSLYNILKTHYTIDDDRIFIEGFSAGGSFCLTLPVCLPGFIAVSAPGCPPIGALNLPAAGAQHACIGTGGTTDGYNTDTTMRNVNDWYRANGVDAECYVFDMGHMDPPDDPTVNPPLVWQDIVLDYFLTHPRFYATRHAAPPSYVADCLDEFQGPAAVPNASDWRVELFDGAGVRYGPVHWDGNPGSGVYGYKFRVQEGWLHSEPVGTRVQGGICVGGFLRRPAHWETAFIANAIGADLILWPAILRDMTGRCVALRLTPGGWAWESADTHLALRANHTPSLQTLANGPLSWSAGERYVARIAFDEAGLTWELLDSGASVVACGTIPASQVGLDNSQFGFGLRGTNASVKFDFAHMEGQAPSVVPES